MEDIWSSMLIQQRLLSNQLEMLSKHLEIMQIVVIHPQPINCDFCGGKYFNDSCHLYSMENSWWEQELHPYNQYKEERLFILENVLMHFMETSQARFKANQSSIQNLEIQLGKL
ncbi:hypothetical protein HKD37_07G019279 [Glycine soja]